MYKNNFENWNIIHENIKCNPRAHEIFLETETIIYNSLNFFLINAVFRYPTLKDSIQYHI